jgi:hypothetical protein
MKARSKYGSVYPGTRPAPKAVAVAAASTTTMKSPHERDVAVDEGCGHADGKPVTQAHRAARLGLPDTGIGAEMNNEKQKSPAR